MDDHLQYPSWFVDGYDQRLEEWLEEVQTSGLCPVAVVPMSYSHCPSVVGNTLKDIVKTFI